MAYSLDFNFDAGKLKQSAEDAAQAAANHLRGAAVDKTPVETGALRASARVSTSGTRAAVSYNTPYAARQHEEIGWSHPGGGQAKFLESAMREQSSTIRAIIAEHIRKGLQ